jgi:transcriptional regulator with AAA-type ATPase domain
LEIFTDAERAIAKGLAGLLYCNPFLPERIACEKEALGNDFVPSDLVWSIRPSFDGQRSHHANLAALEAPAQRLAEQAHAKLIAGQSASAREADLYQDVILYLLYHRMRDKLNEMLAAPTSKKVEGYRAFLALYERYFHLPNLTPRYEPGHLFASFFQVRRAFHHIYQHIVGSSMPAARLRASVWQSVFTTDMRRYQRVLYNRLGDFTTLICGPSGTGKEVVARAIGLSRYIPFDEKTLTFADDFRSSFHALNLSALSPTLIESELFGHRRGAFTGALEDRAGWLEVCRPLGTVFLDEIGEIDGGIQVKLLRLLQTRTFQRIGDTQTKTFAGKIIAATNRDLARQMQLGQIREDFYYRLCSDMIVTPSLRDILRDSPQELRNLVLFIALQVTDEKTGDNGSARPAPKEVALQEAEALSDEVVGWVDQHLGRDYPWPGNFRELEQCVRNVLIRGQYLPPRMPLKLPRRELEEAVSAGGLTADELLRRYCTLVYAQTQNYEETARRLGIDRRTVKAKVDLDLLARFQSGD